MGLNNFLSLTLIIKNLKLALKFQTNFNYLLQTKILLNENITYQPFIKKYNKNKIKYFRKKGKKIRRFKRQKRNFKIILKSFFEFLKNNFFVLTFYNHIYQKVLFDKCDYKKLNKKIIKNILRKLIQNL